MPQAPKSRLANLREWISSYPNGVYAITGKILYCHACNKEVFCLYLIQVFYNICFQVKCERSFQLKQHDETLAHQKNLERFERDRSKQTFLTNALASTGGDEFSYDLCNAMLGANIPFNKINFPSFKSFLEKYCKRTVPSDATLRNYLGRCYEKVCSS